MDYRKFWFICPLFLWGLFSCTSTPHLVGLENWSDPDFTSENRRFREHVSSAFIQTPNGVKILNPAHILGPSDLLELSCSGLLGTTTSRISLNAYFYDDLGDEIYQTIANEAKTAIVPLGVISDFHKLDINCLDKNPGSLSPSSTIQISFCADLDNGDCSNIIGISSWQELQNKFATEDFPVLLRPRHDPVLQPFDQIRFSRTRVVGKSGYGSNIFGLVDNWLLEVNGDGLLPLPIPGITPAGIGPDFDYLRDRAWLSSAISSMYALEISTGFECSDLRVQLSTVQACLNWAGRDDLGLSASKQTPSMKNRFKVCEELGIDDRYEPFAKDTLNSWLLELESKAATLIVEDGRSFTFNVEGEATLLSTIQDVYKRYTGKELRHGWIGSPSIAYLTVQPSKGMCRDHATPFFIRVDNKTSEKLSPIRLFRGDTIQISRSRPKEIKND